MLQLNPTHLLSFFTNHPSKNNILNNSHTFAQNTPPPYKNVKALLPHYQNVASPHTYNLLVPEFLPLTICGIFFMQQYSMSSGFYIEGELHIVKNGELFLNLKRIELLKRIKQKGSINSASKELKMSYQQAWHFIKEMNDISPLPLVIRQRGGSHGGGAVLTNFGEKAIAGFEQLNLAHKRFKLKLDKDLWLCSFNHRYSFD